MQRVAQNSEYTIEQALRTEPQNYRVRGPGLHTGITNEVTLAHKPGLEWIEFSTKIEGVQYSAPALWTRLSGTTRSTALVLRGNSKRRFELHTVEHFLAAAHIFDLQGYSVKIDVSAQGEHVLEMPILDGSSKEWLCLKAFESEQDFRERKVWLAVKPFELEDQDRKVRIDPLKGHSTQITCFVDFGGPWKQQSSFSIDWLDPISGRLDFEKNIASARTFGFKHELEELVARGLIRGASLDNALLLDGTKVWNQGGFRVHNELAAHKLLDAIGDFALLGRPVIGHIQVDKAGHNLHLRAAAQATKTGALIEATLCKDGSLKYSVE